VKNYYREGEKKDIVISFALAIEIFSNAHCRSLSFKELDSGLTALNLETISARMIATSPPGGNVKFETYMRDLYRLADFLGGF